MGVLGCTSNGTAKWDSEAESRACPRTDRSRTSSIELTDVETLTASMASRDLAVATSTSRLK